MRAAVSQMRSMLRIKGRQASIDASLCLKCRRGFATVIANALGIGLASVYRVIAQSVCPM